MPAAGTAGADELVVGDVLDDDVVPEADGTPVTLKSEPVTTVTSEPSAVGPWPIVTTPERWDMTL